MRTTTKVPKLQKKALIPRTSLAGAWKEVSVEALDLTGDGSGWRASGGRAELVGVSVEVDGSGAAGKRGRMKALRKSGVEVLDLTGA